MEASVKPETSLLDFPDEILAVLLEMSIGRFRQNSLALKLTCKRFNAVLPNIRIHVDEMLLGAAEDGDVEGCEEAIRKGADVFDDMFIIGHIYGHPEITKLAERHGTSPNKILDAGYVREYSGMTNFQGSDRKKPLYRFSPGFMTGWELENLRTIRSDASRRTKYVPNQEHAEVLNAIKRCDTYEQYLDLRVSKSSEIDGCKDAAMEKSFESGDVRIFEDLFKGSMFSDGDPGVMEDWSMFVSDVGKLGNVDMCNALLSKPSGEQLRDAIESMAEGGAARRQLHVCREAIRRGAHPNAILRGASWGICSHVIKWAKTMGADEPRHLLEGVLESRAPPNVKQEMLSWMGLPDTTTDEELDRLRQGFYLEQRS